MERDVQETDTPSVQETDTTRRLESTSLEGSGQPLPTSGQPAPTSPSFVYALGQVEPRFPTLAVEKEFVQGTGRTDAAGLTDREALLRVLSDRANRYLLRQLCWVFMIEGLETYLLTPRDPVDLELLVGAVRPEPNPTDLDVVIGMRGPLARPEVCNGLVVPIVVFDQLYSFDRPALLSAIPRPDEVPEKEDKRFRAAAAQLLDRIMQLADNAGATDEHRALNYLAVRSPAIYAQTAAEHAGNASLTAVDVRSSRLSGARKIVDAIFSYTHRQTDVTEKYFLRVDVTEEFPFLVTKLSPYYER
jgi:PatG C-terminal